MDRLTERIYQGLLVPGFYKEMTALTLFEASTNLRKAYRIGMEMKRKWSYSIEQAR